MIVTWTVAEAKALADVLTPGAGTDQWFSYRHNFDNEYKSLIRKGAPALGYLNGRGRLGIYSLTQIASKRVICVKSDLHMSQDGPKLPVRMLWKQAIEESGAELIITTGTAGGIGASTLLGDVIVTKNVRFDCQKSFKNAGFANETFTDTHSEGSTSKHFKEATKTLIPVNTVHLPPSARPAQILHSTSSHPVDVLTTDFFAFDDTTDHWGLRATDPRARAVEMGDAVLGLVCKEDIASPPAWVAVRNASDPQMDGSLSVPDQEQQAAQIYERYGYWTTVCSAIVCWALVAG